MNDRVEKERGVSLAFKVVLFSLVYFFINLFFLEKLNCNYERIRFIYDFVSFVYPKLIWNPFAFLYLFFVIFNFIWNFEYMLFEHAMLGSSRLFILWLILKILWSSKLRAFFIFVVVYIIWRLFFLFKLIVVFYMENKYYV